jgi:hypothetical protein
MEVPEYTDAMHDFVNKTVIEIQATLMVGTVAKFPDISQDEQVGIMAVILSFVIERLGIPLDALGVALEVEDE